MKYIFKIGENECFWGGTSNDGKIAPFDKKTKLWHDFRKDCENQTMPMLLSNNGRVIISDKAFEILIEDGKIEIEGDNVREEQFGSTLRSAYCGAMRKFFPPRGNMLPTEFFKTPQYNTWMQFIYEQNQKDVLRYAHDIIKNGFEPGVFMIDEGWQRSYGDWRFDELKFPDPKGMINELHSLGFKVMLWVVPFVTPNGRLFYNANLMKEFNPENYDKIFLRTADGEPALSHWWDGYSFLLDFTKDCDRAFMKKQLDALMKDYGVDGFKFDGGQVNDYGIDVIGEVNRDHTPNERNIAWNDFGAQYAFHEYKDTFMGGGKRTIQRIRDRFHSWDNDGLDTLIPYALMQGILGHPFICPDMIGGGEWMHRAKNLPIDEELFVRMAQCSALFPMMQFSWAPWEALSPKMLDAVRSAAKLHSLFSDKIIALVKKAEEDGEPILRSMEYNYPHCGYENIKDQFMLGEDIISAPVIKKDAREKEVCLPEGRWRFCGSEVYDGGKTVCVDAPLEVLPYFERV